MFKCTFETVQMKTIGQDYYSAVLIFAWEYRILLLLYTFDWSMEIYFGFM